jgi:ribosomal protein S18 acetylase RimI-like enzyme
MDPDLLAARSILGFAETLARLGRSGVRGATEVREPAAIGARVPWAADNHWIDAAVVPAGATAPAPSDVLPHCLWSARDAPGGWTALADTAMPCMALELEAAAADATAERPSPAVVGALNDEAYGQSDRLAPLLAALPEGDGVAHHGLRVDGEWACVAVSLTLGDDVSIQYVATPQRFRRRGLATALLRAILADAYAAGARTATLQASPDGQPVYERLGFRTVATLRGFARDPGDRSTAPRARTGTGAP